MSLSPLEIFIKIVFQCRDRLPDVYRGQILTNIDGPRAEKVKCLNKNAKHGHRLD